MKRISTYEEMAAVINKPYIDYKGVMTLVPVGEKAAQKIIKTIQEIMAAKGEPIISTRPRLVPTEYILEEFNLNVSTIMQRAKEMKNLR